MDYLAGVRLNLWYTGFWLEKHLNYLTGLGLILLYTGFGLIKWIIQAEIPLEKYKDFLEAISNIIKSNFPWSYNVGCLKKNINVVGSKVS